MTTEAQIEAARTAWFKAGGLFAEGADTAFRAALEAAERAAWRDISTAPKDGTPILIRFRHANHEFAGDQRHKWEEVCVARWIDHNGGGWTWNGICGRPVDWCPVPAPPEGTPA